MAHLSKLWAGNLFGTNTGKLAVEFNLDGEEVTGIVRFLDDRFGLSVFTAKGRFDGSKLEIEGTPTQQVEGVELGTIQATAALGPDGQLRGKWESTLGTGGTLQLFPHQDPNAPPPTPPGPRELHTITKRLGVLRIGRAGLAEIIKLMVVDFAGGQLLVTFEHQGNERTIYGVDLPKHTANVGALHRFRLQIQEPEGNGVNRFLAVEFDATTGNVIRAQSSSEAWAVGKAETIGRHLRRHRVLSATLLKRSGLLPIVFLSALLIFSPEIANVSARTGFVVSVVLLLGAAVQLLNRLIPDSTIYPAQDRQALLMRIWPGLGASLITIATGVASGLIYAWLSGMLFHPSP